QSADPALAYVALDRAGGQPCDSVHAAVRRWTAPADGMLSISGGLSHASAAGDGIAAAIVSSRSGTVGRWQAQQSKVAMAVGPIEVRQGETIDFVIDGIESTDGDQTEWPVDLRLAGADDKLLGHWNSATDFSGPSEPPLTAQVAYAWQLAFGRPVTAEELSVVGRFLSRRIEALSRALHVDPSRRAMADLAQQLLIANEFLYVD
ncbi:MAG TPA: hypothetical protein VMF30_01580, partial [Pirellulales bacterium]|nr:hypothetical protein [Pirellulales bacterium]